MVSVVDRRFSFIFSSTLDEYEAQVPLKYISILYFISFRYFKSWLSMGALSLFSPTVRAQGNLSHSPRIHINLFSDCDASIPSGHGYNNECVGLQVSYLIIPSPFFSSVFQSKFVGFRRTLTARIHALRVRLYYYYYYEISSHSNMNTTSTFISVLVLRVRRQCEWCRTGLFLPKRLVCAFFRRSLTLNHPFRVVFGRAACLFP